MDEAAQWVLHAAQLPQEVANAFVNNMVTGYDFPELAARQVRAEGKERGGGGPRRGGCERGTERGDESKTDMYRPPPCSGMAQEKTNGYRPAAIPT